MHNKTLLILFVVVSGLLIAGCVQQQPGPQTPTQTTVPQTPTSTMVQPADTIRVGSTPLGNVLVDARGMSLYYLARDIPANGTSSCTGTCAVTWPSFSVDNIAVSSPLVPSDFSAVTRADGAKQLAYKGWPLHFFHNDTKPGDTNGEGILGVWFVMKPDYSVLVAQQGSLGTFLADATGKTLYVSIRDGAGVSNCTGSCIVTWPAFNAGSIVAPSLLKGTDFSKISRADGVNQSAYMGRPLHYFSGDAKPGDTKGNAVNNVWFVANVSGAVPVVVTPATTAITVVPTTKPTTVSGRYGY